MSNKKQSKIKNFIGKNSETLKDNDSDNKITQDSFNSNFLGERIFKDFTLSYEKLDKILEFDIIQVDENLLNKSPIITIENNIAIESWCIKPLYLFLYEKLLSFNSKKIILNDELVNQLTRLILLINPNLTFVWNLRKSLIEDKVLNIIEELKFSELVLKKKPKSPENFIHREWLISNLFKNNQLTEQVINEELKICLNAADRYPSNYYAWNYRYYLVNNFLKNNLDFLTEENDTIRKWITNHFSDYSCYNYKQVLLNLIFDNLNEKNEKDKIIQFLNNEKLMLKKLSQVYPDREAIFCHKRYLLKFKYENFGLDSNEIDEEKIFVKHNYNLAKKCENKWLTILTNRYVKWIEYKCKISIDVN